MGWAQLPGLVGKGSLAALPGSDMAQRRLSGGGVGTQLAGGGQLIPWRHAPVPQRLPVLCSRRRLHRALGAERTLTSIRCVRLAVDMQGCKYDAVQQHAARALSDALRMGSKQCNPIRVAQRPGRCVIMSKGRCPGSDRQTQHEDLGGPPLTARPPPASQVPWPAKVIRHTRPGRGCDLLPQR